MNETSYIGNILALLTTVSSGAALPYFFRVLRMYRDPFYLETLRREVDPTAKALFPKDILRSRPVEEIEEVDAGSLIEKLKENDRKNAQLSKTGNFGAESAAILVGVPAAAIAGSELGSTAVNKLKKKLLDNYTDSLREEFIEEMRRTVDFARKIKEDRLGLAEILSLPDRIREELAIELYNRTGKDFSAVLGFKKSPLSGKPLRKYASASGGSEHVKSAIFDISPDAVSKSVQEYLNAALSGATDAVSKSVQEYLNAALSGAGEVVKQVGRKVLSPALLVTAAAATLGTLHHTLRVREESQEQISSLREQLKQWRASINRSMLSRTDGVIPSSGFFQELPETTAKRKELLRGKM